MAARILSTTHSDPTDDGKCNCVVRRGGIASRRAFVRPCALGLVTLGILVFIWGLSYKLSEYQTKITPCARGTVAKLWTETRRDIVTPAGHSALGHRLQVASFSLPTWHGISTATASSLVGAPEQTLQVSPPRPFLPSRGPPASLLV